MKKQTIDEKIKKLLATEVNLAESDKVEFSLELNNLMKERGLTIKDLAAKIGKTEAYLTKIISGNEKFTIETMAKIVSALDSVLKFSEEKKEKLFKSPSPNSAKKPENPILELGAGLRQPSRPAQELIEIHAGHPGLIAERVKRAGGEEK